MMLMKKQQQKNRADWTPTMEERSSLEGRQLKCLIASEGHLWMRSYFDRLSPTVRRRLAESAHNICAACLTLQARRTASKPSAADYFRLIESIEKKLTQEQQK
jgi:hypothetical protein